MKINFIGIPKFNVSKKKNNVLLVNISINKQRKLTFLFIYVVFIKKFVMKNLTLYHFH